MDVEVEKPHVHHPVGHRKLDLVLPVAALFVSLVSIGIAYHHGHIMQALVAQNERLVQANSLPHLSHAIRTMSGSPSESRITFRVANDGVGPADVRSVEMVLDGRPVRNPTDLLGRFGIPGGELSVTQLSSAMVRPGVAIDYFDLRANPAIAANVERMIEAAQSDRFVVKVCYCSVFDECWTVGGNQRPVAVAQCPAPRVPYE